MAAWRKGTLVECICDGHKRNVPVGTVGVVTAYAETEGLYKVRWFAYPEINEDDDLNDIKQRTPDYFGRELRKVEK
jgi:hypothetical protein